MATISDEVRTDLKGGAVYLATGMAQIEFTDGSTIRYPADAAAQIGFDVSDKNSRAGKFTTQVKNVQRSADGHLRFVFIDDSTMTIVPGKNVH